MTAVLIVMSLYVGIRNMAITSSSTLKMEAAWPSKKLVSNHTVQKPRKLQIIFSPVCPHVTILKLMNGFL
jgi:hypothetical protein